MRYPGLKKPCTLDYEVRLYPRMRPPEEHAWALCEWLGPHGGEFSNASTWLKMAAGLKKIEIDTTAHDPSAAFCAQAWEYEDASSITYSRWQTELTRLLYIYAALEELIRGLRPNLDDGAPILPLAIDTMRLESRIPILHYMRVIDHLRGHIDETYLRNKKKLARAFRQLQNEPPGAIALRVGFQVRHLFAHGALVPPEPDDSEITWQASGYAETCIARSAASCLLMSFQVILARQVSIKNPALDLGDLELDPGFWLPFHPFGKEWVYTLPASEYLLTLHLREGDEPQPMISGQLRLSEPT